MLEDLFLLSSSLTISFSSCFSLIFPIEPSYLPTVGNVADVHGTIFVVFNIFAHPASGNLVAAFYEAEALELVDGVDFASLRDLDRSHEADLYARADECVAVADYEMVMDWVKNSDEVNQKYHVAGHPPCLAEVSSAPRRKQSGGALVKSLRIAQVPGVALVGECFIDPECDGETSLGLCVVVPRPSASSRSTTRSFYKPIRYYDNHRRKSEQSTTREVEAWVKESKGKICVAIKVFTMCGILRRSTKCIFINWWRTYVLHKEMNACWLSTEDYGQLVNYVDS